MNTFLTGNSLEIIETLPSESVHCCVTSPPYWRLRDYGVEGQIGLEQTPEEYVNKLVNVFRAVRRVLRTDGTLWLNLGDSYASGGQGGGGSFTTERSAWKGKDKIKGWRSAPSGLKNKDLVGIPWMVAFALRADGWFLRTDIIWEKPNAMPSSVRDRPTRSHEYIFLLSKSSRYFYDADSIREHQKTKDPIQLTFKRFNVKHINPIPSQAKVSHRADRKDSTENIKGRNKRTVWTISTKPFKGAHFAVFPPDLVRPCILAGSPKGGMVLDPFGGSGTVAMVARELGRDSIFIDLKPQYTDMAQKRIRYGGCDIFHSG
ncbi:site-specific DNA-methyltransferase [Desulfosporosinus fructosivorans]|uniref:Methyltransferase n=1 Tax=Desulfosporosinus fructosivorans TaxID=2018669 RepID=A0A4Z0R2N1_9FIRM|nr:site-specific DNA-methyltransferase [Desulfosporosinus fructosivorans]TGE35896.1 site-specific DNA-methyltransferase [Desulfosporosinus fructosivorans]